MQRPMVDFEQGDYVLVPQAAVQGQLPVQRRRLPVPLDVRLSDELQRLLLRRVDIRCGKDLAEAALAQDGLDDAGPQPSAGLNLGGKAEVDLGEVLEQAVRGLPEEPRGMLLLAILQLPGQPCLGLALHPSAQAALASEQEVVPADGHRNGQPQLARGPRVAENILGPTGGEALLHRQHVLAVPCSSPADIGQQHENGNRDQPARAETLQVLRGCALKTPGLHHDERVRLAERLRLLGDIRPDPSQPPAALASNARELLVAHHGDFVSLGGDRRLVKKLRGRLGRRRSLVPARVGRPRTPPLRRSDGHTIADRLGCDGARGNRRSPCQHLACRLGGE
mmetsp:Transcript_4146/g.11812  ORF Transcript_4146/g.11812 Transcript_4146/m.11812 type:complete len:337 (+) Transcript_4146:1029-2039(+)